MADAEGTTAETAERADEATTEQAKPEIPAEVKRALSKANKEAEALRLKLKEFEDRDKSEAEKAAERIAKAEQAARDAEARALRREVALEHKLTKDDASLLDSITDEDAMRRLAERLASAAVGGKKSNHVPREGTSSTSGGSDERELARSLFAGD